MFEQLFIWCHIVNTLVRLDGVVEIDEAHQADLAVFPTLKCLPLVPHLHNGADHAFGLAIGLGPVNSRELLTDTELKAGLHESMTTGSFELFAIV